VTTKPVTTTQTAEPADDAAALSAARTGGRSGAAIRAATERLSRVPAQQAARDALTTHFRMPGTPDPKVRLRRLAAVSAWAAALGFGGLILVLRIMIGLFTDIATWYLVTTFALGLVGFACTLGAFGSVHKHRLPWLLLGAATLAELICFAATFLG
jgi:hypothetical protein